MSNNLSVGAIAKGVVAGATIGAAIGAKASEAAVGAKAEKIAEAEAALQFAQGIKEGEISEKELEKALKYQDFKGAKASAANLTEEGQDIAVDFIMDMQAKDKFGLIDKDGLVSPEDIAEYLAKNGADGNIRGLDSNNDGKLDVYSLDLDGDGMFDMEVQYRVTGTTSYSGLNSDGDRVMINTNKEGIYSVKQDTVPGGKYEFIDKSLDMNGTNRVHKYDNDTQNEVVTETDKDGNIISQTLNGKRVI